MEVFTTASRGKWDTLRALGFDDDHIYREFAKTIEGRDIPFVKLDLPEGSLVNGSGIKFTNFDWPDDPKDAGQNLRASIGVWQWTKDGNEQVFPPSLATHEPIQVPMPGWDKR